MSEKTVIDVEDALRAMREAVADRGSEYVYPDWEDGCYYSDGEQPSCLVGLALNKLGVSLETLEALDGASGYSGSVSADFFHRGEAADTLSGGGFEVTRDAAIVFRAAQSVQDMGGTWGNALFGALTRADQVRQVAA